MSDIFLPKETQEGDPLLTDEDLHAIMDVIEEADQHVFQGLTKHGTETGDIHGDEPRLLEWDREYGRWPDNLWMGVSVENENRAYRMDHLAETSAAVKWVSFEPLVGEVTSVEKIRTIDWAVIGGESADPDDRREMDHAWARTIRDAAKAVGIPVFFKQSSADYPETGRALAEEHSSHAEAKLQGGELTEYREFPDALTDELEAARPDLSEQVVRCR